MAKKNLLYGRTDDNWQGKFGVSQEQTERMMAKLFQGIGTQSAQSSNRVSEINAMNDASLGTQLASQSAIDYNSAMAANDGMFDLLTYADEANRDAWKMIANMRMQKKQDQVQQSQADSAFWGQLFGGLGQGAGSYYGAQSLASAAGPAAAASDIRLKKNIKKVGNAKGYNIYTWDWIDGFDGGYNQGVIAQEVLQSNPAAVVVMDNGYLGVNYSLL